MAAKVGWLNKTQVPLRRGMRHLWEFAPEVSHPGLPEGRFQSRLGFGMGPLSEFWTTFVRKLSLANLKVGPKLNLELAGKLELGSKLELELAPEPELHFRQALERRA